MFEFPWAYQKIEPTTWTYVSSLLMLALFFKFSRIWSVRNLDLVLIILLAPGLLLYDHGTTMEREAVAQLLRLNEAAPLSLTSGGMLESEEKPRLNDADDSVPSQDSTIDGLKESDASPITSSANDSNDKNRSTSNSTELSKGPTSLLEGATQPRSESQGESLSNQKSALLPSEADNAAEIIQLTDGATQDSDEAIVVLQRESEIEHWRGRRSLSHILLYTSFLFLFCVAGVFVLRLLLDQLLVRRPLLENNMTVGGLSFLVASFLTFLVANIIVSSPMQTDLYGAATAASVLGDGEAEVDVGHQEMGPAYPLIHLLPVIPTVIRDSGASQATSEVDKSEQRSQGLVWVAKLVAILSQFAIVAGLIALGRFHFNSMQTGVGMATMYLMLPYTAQMAGRVDHVLPGALLIWAAVLYRRPYWAGVLFGMTMGLVYYPIFLLALWISFYWDKGAARFVYGVSTTILLLVLSLLFFSTEEQSFWANLQGMFGVWLPRVRGLKGIWEFGWDPAFRLPILVAFVSLCVSFVAWPVRKTYGTLLAYSAAMMVAVQFWHGYGGGLFMAWYLPLTIAAFFRPNVQERIAKYDVY